MMVKGFYTRSRKHVHTEIRMNRKRQGGINLCFERRFLAVPPSLNRT
jgi:hypothetical protein